MSWNFAIINGRLAEIFFDTRGEKPVIHGHCYVKKGEYKTAREQRWIKTDTKRYRFMYRNKKYIGQTEQKPKK